MKSLLLAGASLIAAGNVAFAQGYWVTGNRASGKCEIVTSNPVINSQVGGNVTFGSGPYRSNDDAKLARARPFANARRNRPTRTKRTRTIRAFSG